MNGVVKYRVLKVVGPAMVLAYVVIAVIATTVRNRELFPFFRWSLFSNSSNPKVDTVLIVRAVNGAPLQTPRLYYDMPETFSEAAARNAAAMKTFDLLASAVRSNNTSTEQRFRRVVEQTYLREARSVDYDLARIVYDPIERFHTGKIIGTKVLASYEKRDAG